MTTSSDGGPAPRLKRSKALNCLLVNQFATPGLGSLMGGRILAGIVQLGLALLGFGLVVAWFIGVFTKAYHDAMEQPGTSANYSFLGLAGFGAFACSWVLSWFTSISLLRNSLPDEKPAPAPKPVPPVIKP